MGSEQQGRKIGKVLVANRGEIACRIIRTCKQLGIQTVAIFSQVDANAPFVKQADESSCIGAAQASLSYLNIDKIIEVAQRFHVDAIHPGYGFLSENAAFSAACVAAGIIFIGPSAESISAMGDKLEAKNLLLKREPQIPVIPGYSGNDQTDSVLVKEACNIGFPVLIKAAMGGGGKGMRIVWEMGKLLSAIDSARMEAKNAFGDSKLLLEKYFQNVRHVEVQIIGDLYGNVTHLYERECSVQRRHQKIIEEAPCVIMTSDLREKMTKAAVRIGELISYTGAGTVEFIVDTDLNFYFLEVNTRLQVEHPVTELITGLDLVAAQIQIAQGFSLHDLQLTEKINIKGHAIQARLYAEDPDNNFLPSPGPIYLWNPGKVESVRFDSGVESGTEISIYYDPLISKIIAHGETREIAIKKLIRALELTIVHGLTTNRQFLIQALRHSQFQLGNVDTHFIHNHKIAAPQSDSSIVQLAIIAMLWDWNQRGKTRTLWKGVRSGFRNNPFKMQHVTFASGKSGKLFSIEYQHLDKPHGSRNNRFELIVGDNPKKWQATIERDGENTLFVELGNILREYTCLQKDNKLFVHSSLLGEHVFVKKSRFELADSSTGECIDNQYVAPMTAKVWKVLVKDGEQVKPGQILVILESMKMELKQAAKVGGTVKIHVREGQLVSSGAVLLTVIPTTVLVPH